VAERNRRLKLAFCAKYSTSPWFLPDLRGDVHENGSQQEAERFEEALQQEDDSDAEVLQLATNYGQIACRALCQNMVVTLPKELRDMIYEHLFSCEGDTVLVDGGDFACDCPTSDEEDSDYVDDSEVSETSHTDALRDEEKDNNAGDDKAVSDEEVDYEYGLFSDSEETIDNEAPGADGEMEPSCRVHSYGYEGKRNKDFYNSGFFDEETLREIAKTWYRMKILDLDQDWKVLPPVLVDDTWGLGLLPKDHIRAIKLELDHFMRPVPGRQGCILRGPSLQRCYRFRELENTLAAFMKPLYGLREGGMVLITIEIPEHWLENPDDYFTTLCMDSLKELFSLLGILQEDRSTFTKEPLRGLRVLVFPTGEHARNKWALRALNGRVPTFENWWKVGKTVMGSPKSLDKGEDIVLSKTDHEWYRMLNVENRSKY
jgi:hypothetical protein